MSPSPDRRPGLPIKKETSVLLSPEEAGKLLFSLFGDVNDGLHLPEATQKLVKSYRIYEGIGGNPKFQFKRYGTENNSCAVWEKHYYSLWNDYKTDTSISSPDAPAICPENINQADRLITCTYGHYWFGGNPTIEIGFTEKGESFIWGKKSLLTKKPFKRLSDPGIARELLRKEPVGKNGQVALISLWEKSNNRYLLEANLSLHGISLTELLHELKTKQE
ncbi:MAG: hypothetical protein V1858_05375 [Candidatus Gottesmanbacteria bacterium]